jgi:hypothetical protein
MPVASGQRQIVFHGKCATTALVFKIKSPATGINPFTTLLNGFFDGLAMRAAPHPRRAAQGFGAISVIRFREAMNKHRRFLQFRRRQRLQFGDDEFQRAHALNVVREGCRGKSVLGPARLGAIFTGVKTGPESGTELKLSKPNFP